MANVCTVCAHPERETIDRLLAKGVAVRQIPSHVSQSPGYRSLARHANHLQLAMAPHIAQLVTEKVEREMTAHDEIRSILAELKTIAKACTEARRYDEYLEVSDRLMRATDILGRITGEIASGTVSQLFVSLGVSGESDLRRAVELSRGAQDLSLEQCRDDALELLRLCLREHPEWRGGVLTALAGRVSITNGDGI